MSKLNNTPENIQRVPIERDNKNLKSQTIENTNNNIEQSKVKIEENQTTTKIKAPKESHIISRNNENLQKNENTTNLKTVNTENNTNSKEALSSKTQNNTIAKKKEKIKNEREEAKENKGLFDTFKILLTGQSHFNDEDAINLNDNYGAKDIYNTKNNPRRDAIYRNLSVKSVKLIWITFFACIILITWATFFKLDSIVRGSGQVVPSQRIQEVQNLEGGILREIFVKEGTQVEEGELLARIENESAGSQYREALSRSLDYKAAIARLTAILEDSKVEYPNEVLLHPELVLRHNTILQAMQTQSTSEYNVLKLQADAKEKESAELEAKKNQLESRLVISQKQRDLGKSALAKQAFSEIEFLELENNVVTIEADLQALEHTIPRVAIEVEEMKERLNRYEAEKKLTNSQELARIQADLISIEELLTAGSDRVSRTELRSPVRGVVNRLHHNTIGGVVAPAATIMEIVPSDDRLIIEARFSPADIGFLSEGLNAIIRLSAYDFASYGSVKGVVEQVSADTIQDNNGMIYYIVKVRTDEKMYNKDGVELPYIAGMQAEVDVITGKQSILDYLLKPLLRIGNRALTER